MKKYIVVTGGAGFVGSNLISYLLRKTKNKIISIDNYSSGSKNNHIKNSRVFYIKSNTSLINKKLFKLKNQIHSIFHFGEYSRIYRSFEDFDLCYDSNSIGSKSVFKFCLDNSIKLIYSQLLLVLVIMVKILTFSIRIYQIKKFRIIRKFKKWFSFKYEVIYFYNVYGPNQIKTGTMSTVIGIFEDLYDKNKPLTVVKPGYQSRRFTHILDTIEVCFEAWKKNKCRHYSISHKKSYSILEVANLYNRKIKFLKPRSGERYASALTKISHGNNIIQRYGKIDLKDYIRSFIESRNYENKKFT